MINEFMEATVQFKEVHHKKSALRGRYVFLFKSIAERFSREISDAV